MGKIPKLGGGVWPKPTSWCLFTKLFLACQNDSEVLKHVLQKGGGDIWSILTLNNIFFWGKMEETRVAEGGFTYSHNIVSVYHPKWWFFGEDHKCFLGSKMKNEPNFFLITGVSGGEILPTYYNPVFFWRRPLQLIYELGKNWRGRVDGRVLSLYLRCPCGPKKILPIKPFEPVIFLQVLEIVCL